MAKQNYFYGLLIKQAAEATPAAPAGPKLKWPKIADQGKSAAMDASLKKFSPSTQLAQDNPTPVAVATPVAAPAATVTQPAPKAPPGVTIMPAPGSKSKEQYEEEAKAYTYKKNYTDAVKAYNAAKLANDRKAMNKMRKLIETMKRFPETYPDPTPWDLEMQERSERMKNIR